MHAHPCSLWLTLALSGSLFLSLWLILAHSLWLSLALSLALLGAYWLTRSLLGSPRCAWVATAFPALVTRLFWTNPLYNSSAISSWSGLFKRDGNRRLNDIKLEAYSAKSAFSLDVQKPDIKQDKNLSEQGNYSLRRPPKLIIPQAVIVHSQF